MSDSSQLLFTSVMIYYWDMLSDINIRLSGNTE